MAVKETKVWYKPWTMLIGDVLCMPSHPTENSSFLFRGKPVKMVCVMGMVAGKDLRYTPARYLLKDDTGGIWVRVNHQSDTLTKQFSENEVLLQRISRELTDQQCDKPVDMSIFGDVSVVGERDDEYSQDAITLLNYMATRTVMATNRLVKEFQLGTVLKVQGWVLQSSSMRSINSSRVAVVSNPQKEMEQFQRLAEIYQDYKRLL